MARFVDGELENLEGLGAQRVNRAGHGTKCRKVGRLEAEESHWHGRRALRSDVRPTGGERLRVLARRERGAHARSPEVLRPR